jgi:hypothetical protein
MCQCERTARTVDLAALAAALGSDETAEGSAVGRREGACRAAELQRAIERASARIAALEAEVEVLRSTERQLKGRLAQVARIARIDGGPPAGEQRLG